jgi:hypothetical protein
MSPQSAAEEGPNETDGARASAQAEFGARVGAYGRGAHVQLVTSWAVVPCRGGRTHPTRAPLSSRWLPPPWRSLGSTDTKPARLPPDERPHRYQAGSSASRRMAAPKPVEAAPQGPFGATAGTDGKMSRQRLLARYERGAALRGAGGTPNRTGAGEGGAAFARRLSLTGHTQAVAARFEQTGDRARSAAANARLERRPQHA